MAEARIECLSRLTAGEISKNQAIIDYFYYDQSLNFADVMKPGFFNKLSKKFKVGSKISVYCLGNNTPPIMPSLKRFDILVGDLVPFSPPRPYELVYVFPLGDSLASNLPGQRWDVNQILFQGLVHWSTPGLPNPTPGINKVLIPDAVLPLNITNTILFNQPDPGDEIGGHLVRTVIASDPTHIEVKWGVVPVGSPPVQVEVDPPGGQACRMYIKILTDIE